MSKSNTFENDLLKLIFTNTTIANIGDATGVVGSSSAGSLYVSLHTSDPGEAGDQTTNEISYTGYSRIARTRDTNATTGFTVTNNSVSPNATVSFGEMTAGAGGTVTHFAIGTASSGAGKILYSGTVSPNISVTSGVTPQLTTASAITED